MAVGLGHMLGYKLPQNFRMPYLAPNIRELWSRWHISLTSWLRDYLFIPLRGQSPTAARWTWSVLITMILCGLWHGANWTLVVFGFLHGCMIVGIHYFKSFCRQRPLLKSCLTSVPGTIVRICVTFCVFALTGVLFRAGNFQTVLAIGSRAISLTPGQFFPQSLSIFWSLLAVVITAHLFVRLGLWETVWQRAPAYVRGFAYACVLSLTLTLTPDAGKAFIYFQF
jgi:alginate O-acetyltransferase complex protein AlgI